MTIHILKKGNNPTEKTLVKRVIHKKKRQPNIRQQRVIAILGAKGGKTKAEILRKAEYSEKVIRNPNRVFDSPIIQEALDLVVAQMQRIRNKTLNAMENKDMEKQGLYNLSTVSSQLTRDSELLAGKPTERTVFVLPPEEEARLRKLLDKNKGK